MSASIDWWGVLSAEGWAVTAALSVVGVFLARWYVRRGGVTIHVGDRTPPEYVTRGARTPRDGRIMQTPPRFMNFSIPLTMENRKGVPVTIRIKNVWFSQGEPEIRKDGWKLPGSSLHPTGLEIRDASGAIADPVRIDAHSIVHVVLHGTATSPVCHAGPFQEWRFVFVDWISTPSIPPLIMEVPMNARSFSEDLKPRFPLPAHYASMQ